MSGMDESITSTVQRPTGRTVRLFLADGLPHGVVIADVGNWNGKALAAPQCPPGRRHIVWKSLARREHGHLGAERYCQRQPLLDPLLRYF
jgi:hypothetical protein